MNSAITIQGNANGITIARNPAAIEFRLFDVSPTGTLILNDLNLTGGIIYGQSGANGENGGDGLGCRSSILARSKSCRARSTTIKPSAAPPDRAATAAIGMGGAIFNYYGNVFIRNSTLSGNTSTAGTGPANGSGSFGGAIYSHNGDLTIDNSTSLSARPPQAGASYILAVEGSAIRNLYSTIIGQSDLPGLGYDLTLGYDTNGELTVAGSNNLIRRQNDFAQITVSTADPLLGPLQNNGGPTLTCPRRQQSRHQSRHQPAEPGYRPARSNLLADGRRGGHRRCRSADGDTCPRCRAITTAIILSMRPITSSAYDANRHPPCRSIPAPMAAATAWLTRRT